MNRIKGIMLPEDVGPELECLDCGGKVDTILKDHTFRYGVKADEVESRLKAAKQDALRGLRDKKDLYEDGEAVLKFGPHRFNVNTQAIELTVLPKDGQLYLSLTGTDFLQPIADPELEKSKAVWDMTLPSESRDVYRAESLAAGLSDIRQPG